MVVCLIVGCSVVAENESSGTTEHISPLSPSPSFIGTSSRMVQEEPENYYEIQFVSPEFLKNILANSAPEDIALKTGPGMIIGLATPKVLYLRSDMQSEELLIKNRETTDQKEKITRHLVDITFGRDNANISLFKNDLDYLFWFDAEYDQQDIDAALAFARLFNNLSQTTQFDDETVMTGELKNNYQDIPYHYYNIKIVPRQFLDEYKDDKFKSASEELMRDKSGTLIGILSKDYVILWNGIPSHDRPYYLTKALLWSMGLHGESDMYHESFFYKSANSSAQLSSLDIEAIKLLYGGRLKTDMTAENVRKALDIS